MDHHKPEAIPFVEGPPASHSLGVVFDLPDELSFLTDPSTPPKTKVVNDSDRYSSLNYF